MASPEWFDPGREAASASNGTASEPESNDLREGEEGERDRAREEQLAREIEQLRKTLEAQRQATREAEKNAANLTEQLVTTKRQIDRSLKQVHGGQRARIERAESAVAQIKAQMHITQRNLEAERRARKADASAAAARVAQVERELSTAVAAEAAARTGKMRTSFRVRVGLTAAAAFASVAAVLLYWGFAPAIGGRTTVRASADAAPKPPVQAQQAQLPRMIRSAPTGAAREPLVKGKEARGDQPPDERADFTQSLDRLSKALSAFPGLAPQEVLRQISLTGGDPECAFNWNNGNPALIYNGGKISMAQTLERCAAAVERYR